MSEKINKALSRYLEKHRLVFWYDEGGEMKEDFNSFTELGVSKIEIEGNEFFVRYTVRKLEPEQKFLIYSRHAKPEDRENWLLDLNLEGFVFASDLSSMVLQDLELDVSLLPLIRSMESFFKNKKERLEPLRRITTKASEDEDSPRPPCFRFCAVPQRRRKNGARNSRRLYCVCFFPPFWIMTDLSGGILKSSGLTVFSGTEWRRNGVTEMKAGIWRGCLTISFKMPLNFRWMILSVKTVPYVYPCG